MSTIRPTGHDRGLILRRGRLGTSTRGFSYLLLAVVLLGLPTDKVAGQELGIFYSNVPGELLLENDKVVVQKFILEPGQWEGVHTHPGNQIYVHIWGGEWTVRRSGQERVSQAADGSVGCSEVTGEDE